MQWILCVCEHMPVQAVYNVILGFSVSTALWKSYQEQEHTWGFQSHCENKVIKQQLL